MIQQLLTTLGFIGGCFVTGMLVQRHLPSYSQRLRLISTQTSLLLVIPFAIMNSLWQLGRIDADLFVVPMLGVTVIISGAITCVATSRLYSLSRPDFASLLPVMSFYNLGALGALFAFIFFGEDGVALLALFKLFEEAINFGIIFPYCRSRGISRGDHAEKFWKNPVFVVSMSALIIGMVLGTTGVNRPDILSMVSQTLIPIGSLLLVFAAGLTFHVSGSQQWLKLSAFAAMVRIILGCSVVTTLFWGFDLWSLGDGILYPVCIMLACMPCGFIGVLPARLYGLNTALSNTSWIATYVMSLISGVIYLFLF
ncbi:hypothetical protein [Thaumasiovibrio sp. DFM-14]|uniref:hypothetical protein n=1 Tax=Thaumasiovibrio sp. DFM-14 TaxID=3384792 RepID=UPI0039A0C55B